MFDEDSEEEESEQISEEDSESDELSNSQIKALSLCEEKNASWTDSAGNSFTWISPNFVKGFNKIFSGVLVNKRVFKIGDTVFISSPRDSPQYIGLIVGLYQVCSFCVFFYLIIVYVRNHSFFNCLLFRLRLINEE
jgi:hypothetical protein